MGNTTPVLIGDRVTLRRIKHSDITDRQRIGRHSEFVRMCGGDSFGAAQFPPRRSWYGWYRKFRREPHRFIMEHQNHCIGAATLKLSDDGKSARYSIGIFDPAQYSCGFGTETTKLMLRYGFETLRLQRIDLMVLEYNERGIRCYESCGFRQVQILRDNAIVDGQSCNDFIMEISRKEFFRQL